MHKGKVNTLMAAIGAERGIWEMSSFCSEVRLTSVYEKAIKTALCKFSSNILQRASGFQFYLLIIAPSSTLKADVANVDLDSRSPLTLVSENGLLRAGLYEQNPS